MLVFCIFRPHRIHSMRMWPPVATDKIAWSVWLLVTTVSRAKTAEPIQMLSVVWTPGIQTPDLSTARGTVGETHLHTLHSLIKVRGWTVLSDVACNAADWPVSS